MKNTRWLLLLVALVMLPAFALAQWTQTQIASNTGLPYAVASADIDGDGDLDAADGGSSNGIKWYENTDGVGGSWTTHTIDAGENQADKLVFIDLDGDSDIDLVTMRSAGDSDEVKWYENTAGDGSAWTEHMIDNTNLYNVKTVVVGDIDGDSDLDVVAMVHTTDVVLWYENTAGDASAWTEHTIDSINAPFDAVLSDIDGDGDLDIAGTTSVGADDIIWYENTVGDGSAWTRHLIQDDFAYAEHLVVGDIDGDNDPDIVATSLSTHVIRWWENTAGDGSTWTGYDLATGYTNAFDLGLADLDGDSDIDVVANSTVLFTFDWFENTAGDGSAWTQETIYTGTDYGFSLDIADVDADGKLDVLGCVTRGDQALFWWRNENVFPPTTPLYISLSGTVTNSSAVSEGVQAGLFASMTDGYDSGYDIPKPAPPASDYLDVYFPHSGWAGDLFGNRWAVDVRDADADLVAGVHVYEITSATDQLGEDVTLTFTLDAEYPAEHPVILVDTSDDSFQDLRSNNVFTYTDAGSHTLNLRVGDLTDPDIAFTAPLDGDDWIATDTHTITFTYSDISPDASHVLEYSVDGQSTWTAVTTLNPGDLDHDWAVPNVFTTDARLRLTSTDIAGNDSTIVSGSFTIAPDTMSTDIVTAFQMISPPLRAADESNAAVFDDDISGTYFVWEWDPTTDYVLSDSTFLGQGYWLASDEAVTVGIGGDAELDSSNTDLASGWNMIGSGMVPQIAKADLYVNDGVTWNSFDDAVTAGWISTALYEYDTNLSSYSLGDSLDTFTGYWLYALTTGLTMTAYPTPSGEFTELDDFDPDMGWLLPIALQMGDVSDQVAGIGVHLNATDTFDAAYDLPVAPLPPAGTFVRAVFDHNDWDAPAGRWYAQDVRGELADDEELSYTFLIQSNSTGAFTLSFGDELPEGLDDDISITAVIDGNAYNLREQREFALNYDGSYIYVDVIVNGALDVEPVSNTGLPMAYELAPAHPNPFNPTTTLAVSLPNPGELNVTVYNITGQQVATLVNGTRAAGVHHVLLDGARLTSGVYFVHAIVPGELNQVRKVVLMK